MSVGSCPSRLLGGSHVTGPGGPSGGRPPQCVRRLLASTGADRV